MRTLGACEPELGLMPRASSASDAPPPHPRPHSPRTVEGFSQSHFALRVGAMEREGEVPREPEVNPRSALLSQLTWYRFVPGDTSLVSAARVACSRTESAAAYADASLDSGLPPATIEAEAVAESLGQVGLVT